MKINFDRSKSLQELEGKDWGEPSWESALVLTCYRLRCKPLKDFTIEDLRIMIGQDIGLLFLMPLAIERLEEHPLAEGDFYPGDLLASVLRVKASFWKEHPELLDNVEYIVKCAMASLEYLNDIDRKTTEGALSEAVEIFTHRAGLKGRQA